MVTRSLVLAVLALAPTMAMGQGLHDLNFDALTSPGDDPGFSLPTRDEMIRPPGYDRFLDMATEIARKSATEQEEATREAARAMGLQPTDHPDPERTEDSAASWGSGRLPQGFRVTVMISAALGDRDLKALFETYAGRPDVRFAFRGVPANMTVPDFALWLQSLFENRSMMETTNIVLDPELFKATDTQLAPTILLEDMTGKGSVSDESDTGLIVASATGFSNPDWIYDRYRHGETHYPSADAVLVTEEDLRERAQREAAAKLSALTVDPDVLMSRYWQRLGRDLDRAPVTPAKQKRERIIHSSFSPQQPIRDHDGKLLAYPGEVFDPSTVLPFDRQILVFDPTRPAELQFVADRLSAPPEGVSRQVLIITRIPETAGAEPPWQGIQLLVERYRLPVYVLTTDFRTAFGIEHTPTEIAPSRLSNRVQVLAVEHDVGEGG